MSSRLVVAFDELRCAGRAALMPYLTMGYPRRESALTLVPALVEAGADLIELGVPFSDPLADGATIQAASQQALENGMSLSLCLEQAATLREQGEQVPLVMMSYYNPILQMGLERFARIAAAAEIDALIVPDLPPEESGPLRAQLQGRNLALIFLLAPSASVERLHRVAEQSSGFLYLVSLTGVTGAREQLAPNLEAFVARVRTATDLPLAVGFGISTPAQAASVAGIADGVIVGSALLAALAGASDPIMAGTAFVSSLRRAIEAVSDA